MEGYTNFTKVFAEEFKGKFVPENPGDAIENAVASDGEASPTTAEFNALVDIVNDILGVLRTAGIIESE